MKAKKLLRLLAVVVLFLVLQPFVIIENIIGAILEAIKSYTLWWDWYHDEFYEYVNKDDK